MKEIPKLFETDKRLNDLHQKIKPIKETNSEEGFNNIYSFDGSNLSNDNYNEDIEYYNFKIKDKSVTRKYDIIAKYFRKKYKDEENEPNGNIVVEEIEDDDIPF